CGACDNSLSAHWVF
nr:immunoglobulin light chain junction region [Macaca mulatta]